MKILLNNPLPLALHHYELELFHVLSSLHCEVGAGNGLPVEGDVGVRGKILMLSNAIRNISSARSARSPRIQLWPSLGIAESRLWRSTLARHAVVIHDPNPIRPQYGDGALLSAWARRGGGAGMPLLITQSEHAESDLRQRLPNAEIARALHPVLPFQPAAPKSETPSMVVAGQYKPERDLVLMRKLGPLLRDFGWEPRIVGRGWPPVTGWSVESRFVGEAELDTILASAWILLLPYKNYYQSGIAVRALEQGTLTAGPSSSFLTDLYGGDLPYTLPRADRTEVEDFARSVLRAGIDARVVHHAYMERCLASWGEILGLVGQQTLT